MRAARGRQVILVSAIALLGALVISAGIGSVRIPPGDVLGIIWSGLTGAGAESAPWPETHVQILWQIRLPRVVMGALVGMALGVAGGAYQGLFRNPLADPYILGVSAGAALGAAVALAFTERFLSLDSLPAALRLGPVPLLSFAFGLGTVALVFRLAASGGRVAVVGVLLAGVAVGSLAMAMVSVIMFVTKPQAREAIVFWIMGGLGGATWSKIGWLLPFLAVGLGTLLYLGRPLNAMLMGEEPAHHLGVEVERLKRAVLVSGALLTAAAVAFCGAIGFVGLVVPHLVRLLIGPDHRYLLPAAGLLGSVVLVAADTLARSLFGPTEIPVGLVMALLGGPFFLWLLRQRLQPREF